LEWREREKEREIATILGQYVPKLFYFGIEKTGQGTRGREGEGREDKNVPTSPPCVGKLRASRCFLPRRGVTFAGCDVENWIQVRAGVAHRREGKGSRDLSGWERGGWKGGARVARRKMPGRKEPSPRSRKEESHRASPADAARGRVEQKDEVE